MKRVKKNQFGYIKYKRNFHLIIAIIMYAMAVLLYFAGIKATGDNKNLLTIAAILGCLPASQSLVTAILGFRAKCCDKNLHEEIERRLEDTMVSMYDLYFTTYDKNYPVSHVVMKNNCLCGLMEQSKHSANELEKYIEETFMKNGIKGVSVKIFEKSMKEKYLNRINELKKLEYEKSVMEEEVIRLLSDISY